MYYKRYIEEILKRKLKSSGAVLVTGPKFCGKTTTSSLFAKSIFRLNTEKAILSVRIDPKIALKGEIPHLIDEWQVVPDIWNYVKQDLDIDYVFGKYILTGSSTPSDKKTIHHSGAGRIFTLKMRTMSLFESNDSKGLISLHELFLNPDMDISFYANEGFSLQDIAYLICRGGWPLSINNDHEISLDITKNYFENLFNFENSGNEKFRNKNPKIFKIILKSYARNVSTEASLNTMMEDVKKRNERTMDYKTFVGYKEALEDLYIIEDMDAWNPNLRSKTSITSTPTRHFSDTSIACAALDLCPDDLINDIKTFGYFFEDFVVRDLRIYCDLFNGNIYHYRDNAGLECDAVIHLDNGNWAAIEIKLGSEELIEYGAKRLNALKNKILNKSNLSAPIFMAVIVACGSLYKRKDGIFVIPINLLKA